LSHHVITSFMRVIENFAFGFIDYSNFQGSESIKVVKFPCYVRFLFPNYLIFLLILHKELFTYLNPS